MHRDSGGVGNAVAHMEELAAERTDLDDVARLDRVELLAVGQPGLVELDLHQAQGERRAVERQRKVPQRIGQCPDVILVAVGQQDGAQLGLNLAQIGEVGKDQVNAQVLGPGKRQPAVDDDGVVAELDDGAVLADFPHAADGHDANGVGAEIVSQGASYVPGAGRRACLRTPLIESARLIRTSKAVAPAARRAGRRQVRSAVLG